MMNKQVITAMEEEEHPEKRWNELLEAVEIVRVKEEKEKSQLPLLANSTTCRRSCSKKQAEEEEFESFYYKKVNKADPLPLPLPLPLPFDFSIPKKKRTWKRATHQEKSPLDLEKLTGYRMTMMLKSTLFRLNGKRQEDEEEDNVVQIEKLKRKRPSVRNLEISNQRKRQEEEEKNNSVRIKKIRRARPLVCNLENLNPTRDLPDNFKRRILEMGTCTKLKLVITKKLTATDCNKCEGRLSMPVAKTANFLEEEEKIFLAGKSNNKKNQKGVKLIQPNLQEIDINLKQWDMNSKMYVLVKPWNDVVRTNGLGEGDTIQVWSFRVGDTLMLAMVRLPNGEERVDIGQLPNREELVDVGQLPNDQEKMDDDVGQQQNGEEPADVGQLPNGQETIDGDVLDYAHDD